MLRSYKAIKISLHTGIRQIQTWMRSSVKAGFFITLILIFLGSGEIYSQSGPGSPYSFFGIGTINEGGTGINKILGGSGIGVRDSLSLNLKNPAAYSAIHPAFTQVTASGFDFNLLNLKTDQGRSLYTDFLFSGINLWVRPFNKAGVNLGIMPYSVVRYDIKSVNTLYGLPGEYTVNYKGSGGITRIYFGAGYVDQAAWWRCGLIASLVSITIWLVAGGLWWKFLGMW